MPGTVFHASAAVSVDGYTIVRGVVPRERVFSLTEALTSTGTRFGVRGAGRGLYAMRNLLGIEEIRTLADGDQMRQLVESVLGAEARPVRGILFDKTPETNWKVAWHQDLSIAVKRRIDVAGFGPWSMKAGVQHVQPPVGVLERMLTVRLHLDDCDESNGPLRVLPGSHAAGVLTDESIAHWRTTGTPESCVCPAGGAVLMRPLLLNASSQAHLPRHRRVIHIEYAAGALPGGLEWSEDADYNRPP
jgi:hypothetical protein